MWWEKKGQPVASPELHPVSAPPEPPGLEDSMTNLTSRSPEPPLAGHEQTVLGQSAVLHGDLAGKEDLLIEGQVEGTINVPDHCVTIGAHGEVKAEIQARQVVVLGSVTGNISAREKIEIRKIGQVVGDLVAAAIAIEGGAFLKGSIDIVREPTQEASPQLAASAAFKAGV
jgi:cytoskeletal protein CcmA (bactofilin family)